MGSVSGFLAAFLAVVIAHAAHANDTVQTVPAQRVIAVKVDGANGYAVAFGKLVGFYLRNNIQVVFPQMSLEGGETSYAAIAFNGAALPDNGVSVFDLPATKVVTQVYTGPYSGLPQSIASTAAAAQKRGCTVDASRFMRLLHRNSPDDTPADKLITEIHIPVNGC